jgi:RNA polymerase sigma factor (sigma-70 family)
MEEETVQQVAQAERSVDRSPLTEQAFAELLRPLIEPGFRLALGMLHDPQAAEDAVQDASITAWRKAGTLRDRVKVRSWFMGVVANQCRNARRRKWTAGVSLGLPEHLSVASVEDSVFTAEDLRRALVGLRHEDRLVVVLYFYLDMPLEDVASTVGSSVAAARARLYRAIQRLRPGIDIEEALR